MKNKIYIKLEQDFKDSDSLTLSYNRNEFIAQTGYSEANILRLFRQINAKRKYEIYSSKIDNKIVVTRKFDKCKELNQSLMSRMEFTRTEGILKLKNKYGSSVEKKFRYKHIRLPLYFIEGRPNWAYDSINDKWIHPDNIEFYAEQLMGNHPEKKEFSF